MTPETYATRAKAELASFIERSTRFTPGEVTFAEEESFATEFHVEVVYLIRGMLSERTLPGRHAPEASDLGAETANEYNGVSRSLLKEAEGQLERVRDLGRMITTSRYGKHIDRFELHRYHRRVLMTYTCPSCAGVGTVTCSSCEGQGSFTCSSCGGSGHDWVTHHETDHHGHTHVTSHLESCSACGGSGHQTCSTCGGSGRETCGTCKGLTVMTDIGTPVLVVDPAYVLASVVPKDPEVVHALEVFATLPRVGEGWARAHARIVEVEDELRRVVESVAFRCPFYRGTVAVGNVTGRMVVFGEKCSVSDAAHLLENLVRPDLEVLQAGIRQLRWYDVPMLRHVQDLARLFMESEVHQQAIEQVHPRWTPGSDHEDLANRLSRALSPDYLRDAIKSVDTVTIWTCTSHDYCIGLAAILIGVTFLMVEIVQGQVIVALAGAEVIYFLSAWLRWWMTHTRLRWIGGQAMVDFAVRRGLARKSGFGWR